MANKNFSIPQPIITNPNCEYFAVRYRKIQPISGNWQTIANINTNQFTLNLDFNSVYEIEATHHCCDGTDSQPTTVTYNTATNNPLMYICAIETLISDSCATTPGNCRNCEVRKSYKFRFFQNSNASTPLTLQNGNLKLRVQETINGVPQPPVLLNMYSGISEFLYGTITTYSETCQGNASQVTTRSLTLLDGTFEEFPYSIISCIANTPTLIETQNTSAGPGNIRTQKFQVGNDILPGNKFQLICYSVTKQVVAVQGDTPTSIAQKLASAINSTSAAQWNQFGSVPTGQNGFPPSASSSGSVVTVNLNYQNQFACAAYEF